MYLHAKFLVQGIGRKKRKLSRATQQHFKLRSKGLSSNQQIPTALPHLHTIHNWFHNSSTDGWNQSKEECIHYRCWSEAYLWVIRSACSGNDQPMHTLKIHSTGSKLYMCGTPIEGRSQCLVPALCISHTSRAVTPRPTLPPVIKQHAGADERSSRGKIGC